MVDERQRQRQMMTTDPNRQHYGPAGGPNKWDMDYPSGGMPTNYQGNSPHFRSGNLDVRYPGDYAHQQNQGIPRGRVELPHGMIPFQPYLGAPPSSGLYGGIRTGEEAWESEKAKRQKMLEFVYGDQGRPHPNPRMRGQGEGGTGLYKGSPFYSNPYYEGIGGLEQETSGLWQTWKKILERTGNEDLANQWLSGQQTAAADTGIGSTNEYQTSGLWQTWKKILERTGNEDLANQWLESQYV